MSLKNLLKVSEKDIETLILQYLNRVSGGFVKKNHQGGKPVKIGKAIIIIPFKNPFCRKGVSDVEFIFKGYHFAFEIKTPDEHGYIKRNLKKILAMKPHELEEKKNKKKKHIYEQFQYIKSIKQAGGYGGFVSSLEEVKEILNKFLKEIDSKTK